MWSCTGCWLFGGFLPGFQVCCCFGFWQLVTCSFNQWALELILSTVNATRNLNLLRLLINIDVIRQCFKLWSHSDLSFIFNDRFFFLIKRWHHWSTIHSTRWRYDFRESIETDLWHLSQNVTFLLQFCSWYCMTGVPLVRFHNREHYEDYVFNRDDFYQNVVTGVRLYTNYQGSARDHANYSLNK